MSGIIAILFFIIGVIFFSIMIAEIISSRQKKKLFLIFIPLIFAIISFVLGIRSNLYFIINISATSGIIIIDKKKLFFCFNKQDVVKISDLKKVMVKIDYETHHKDGYNRFEIIFKLSNGTEVKGCSQITDKDGEARRAFQIIGNALPPRIEVCGNFSH